MVRRHRAADAGAWNLSERRGRWRTRMQGLQGPGSPENRTLVTKTTTQAANRQRIVSSGGSFFRHRITPTNGGRNRHGDSGWCRFKPARPVGSIAGEWRPRPVVGQPSARFPANSCGFPRRRLQRLADAAGGATRANEHRAVANRSRLRHQAKRYAVGPRRQKRSDALSEKTKRCAVGSQQAMDWAARVERSQVRSLKHQWSSIGECPRTRTELNTVTATTPVNGYGTAIYLYVTKARESDC